MSAILGPFYRTEAPEYANGQSMVLTKEDGDVTAHVHGRLTDVRGKPIAGAKIEWVEPAMHRCVALTLL
jgi:catechol 1,2-dioxygenase